MQAGAIWAGALLFYAVFSLWYNNWRGPLTAAEIDGFMARLQKNTGIEADHLADARKFLEADDGREFFMVNLIRLQPGTVPMPGSGELVPARRVVEGYSKVFMPALFRHAGHPAFLGPAVGGYLESWGVEKNPGWTFAGVIRYRSRRDMAELATAPEFDPAHVYKIAGMANTLAFPVSPGMLAAGPRVWVALALALLASLGNLALVVLRG
jgi:hypothetical protein